MGPGVGYRQDVELYIEKMDSDKELWETKSKTSRKIRRLRKTYIFNTMGFVYTHHRVFILQPSTWLKSHKGATHVNETGTVDAMRCAGASTLRKVTVLKE